MWLDGGFSRDERRWVPLEGPRSAAGAPPGSGEEPESADAVEVERADSQFGPTVCFHKATPGDVFLSGFDLRDFAFGFGSFPVAAQELWRPPLCPRGGE